MIDKDIVPDLLEFIQNQFDKDIRKSEKIAHYIKKLENKKATYLDVNDYSVEIGEILSNILQKSITADILPDGKMYFNIADRILKPTLSENYQRITTYGKDVQTLLNTQSKIGYKPQLPRLNQDRVMGIVNRISSEPFEKVSFLLGDPIVTFSQSIVDDMIRENVEAHAKIGLTPVIRRVASGHCCDWCQALVGVYKYGEEPKDVYRRHGKCRCTVDYHPGDGKYRQNVWTKEKKIISKEKRELYVEVEGKSNAQFYKIFQLAKEREYNPLPANKVVAVLRKESYKWIETLTEDEIRSINKYSYNGVDSDQTRLYEKINGFLAGSYTPGSIDEKNMLVNHAINIRSGLLKSEISSDIIVFRKDYDVERLEEQPLRKFLSTSATVKGTFGGKPNVAIIVPKGTKAAYIEELSEYRRQREVLLPNGLTNRYVGIVDNIRIYEVIQNERET